MSEHPPDAAPVGARVSAGPAEDLTGGTVGRFRVDGVLGRGGMSTVYRATDVRLDRRVALKVIDPGLARDEEFRERFLAEARNTSAVDHPHVVPLYEADAAGERLYLAMRFVEGPDLATLIGRRPLAPERTLRLLGQVADALGAVHAHGLVHLDVKPANILVERRAGGGAGDEHAFLADFGLTERGAAGHASRGGDFLGSPTYAAPEHLRGEPVDARTDVYSLGCVLFTCLTGRAPYRGSVGEVIDGHLGAVIPAATAELPDDLGGPGAPFGPEVDDVLRRALAAAPGERHDTARDLVDAVRRALPGARRGAAPWSSGGSRPGGPTTAVPGRSAVPTTSSAARSSPSPSPFPSPFPSTPSSTAAPSRPSGPYPPAPALEPPRRVRGPTAPADQGSFGAGSTPRRSPLATVVAVICFVAVLAVVTVVVVHLVAG